MEGAKPIYLHDVWKQPSTQDIMQQVVTMEKLQDLRKARADEENLNNELSAITKMTKEDTRTKTISDVTSKMMPVNDNMSGEEAYTEQQVPTVSTVEEKYQRPLTYEEQSKYLSNALLKKGKVNEALNVIKTAHTMDVEKRTHENNAALAAANFTSASLEAAFKAGDARGQDGFNAYVANLKHNVIPQLPEDIRKRVDTFDPQYVKLLDPNLMSIAYQDDKGNSDAFIFMRYGDKVVNVGKESDISYEKNFDMLAQKVASLPKGSPERAKAQQALDIIIDAKSKLVAAGRGPEKPDYTAAKMQFDALKLNFDSVNKEISKFTEGADGNVFIKIGNKTKKANIEDLNVYRQLKEKSDSIYTEMQSLADSISGNGKPSKRNTITVTEKDLSSFVNAASRKPSQEALDRAKGIYR